MSGKLLGEGGLRRGKYGTYYTVNFLTSIGEYIAILRRRGIEGKEIAMFGNNDFIS